MEKKKSIKISLSTFFLILSIITIIVMGLFIYKLNTEKNEKTKESAELQTQVDSLSETVNNLQNKIDNISKTNSIKLNHYYTVDIIKFDDAGISNEDNGIKFNTNNLFGVYVGFGISYIGNYEIKNNTIICNSNFMECESGFYTKTATDITFIFNIINDNKLELTNIDIKDSNVNKLSLEDFSVGMTYSIK